MSAIPQPVEAEPLPTTPEQLIAKLKARNIAFELHNHAPIFTVAEGHEIERDIPGIHCRNLFLCDKKKRMALLSLTNATQVDLKKLGALLNLERISFGSPERLWQYLGVRPGSVCPFAVLNDKGGEVPLFLDSRLFEAERVNFHPLLNSMTVGLNPNDLKTFLESEGHVPHIVDLSSAAPEVSP